MTSGDLGEMGFAVIVQIGRSVLFNVVVLGEEGLLLVRSMVCFYIDQEPGVTNHSFA